MVKKLESLIGFSPEQLVDWEKERCIKFERVTIQYAPLDLILENAAYQDKLVKQQTFYSKTRNLLSKIKKYIMPKR